MNLKSLMSGIAVVIDDALGIGADERENPDEKDDRIFKIVDLIKRQWDLPFYESPRIPPKDVWPNLLQAASFILLDWKLWTSGSAMLENEGVKNNIEFLERARDYVVPVLIFTNENTDDVESKLPQSIYSPDAHHRNHIFIRTKSNVIVGESLDFGAIENWFRTNASVYALKTWEKAFNEAKKELFSSMYARSPEWPRVFWKAYDDDGVDPSSSLTHLINDSLSGRMRADGFDPAILACSYTDVPADDIAGLIGETSFRPKESLPIDGVGCGDLFQLPKRKFLLNLRPDCDCIPRNGEADCVELYCIEGKRISRSELSEKYEPNLGQFPEKDWECIAFSIYDNKSVRFNFKNLRVRKFSELKAQRVGRMIHPYLTRIQQRFALYLQRQGLPRIPEAAIPPSSDRSV